MVSLTTFLDSVGIRRNIRGVTLLNPDGSLAAAGGGGGGDASAANQATGNASLATIATNTGAGANAANQVAHNTKLDQLHADMTAATPAGTNSIGSVVAGGNVASAATDSGNPVKIGGVYNATPPTLTTGQRGDLQLTVRGEAKVMLTAVTGFAGADGISNSNTFTIPTQTGSFALPLSGGTLFNGISWDRLKKPNAAARLVSSAATTNATLAKTGSTDLTMLSALNTTAAIKYLKLYNKATAAVPGTDTPVLTIPLVASGTTQMQWPNGGFYFPLGLSYAITGAAADSDTTALAAGDITCLNLSYS